MCQMDHSTSSPNTADRDILPDSTKPTHYSVNITPNFESFTFSGAVDIQLNIIKSTKTIVLNANELIISSAHLSMINVKTESIVQASSIILDQKAETVTFEFPQECVAGSEMCLSIKFTGTHNDKMAGFYRSGYTDSNGNKKYMVVTQFEATDCRRAFPSYDEPNLKATFDITLNVPKNLTALSNMNEVSEKTLLVDGVSLKSVSFARTPIMSTYLVAMAVAELDFVETMAKPKLPADAKPITVRVYTLKGQSEQGKFALGVAAKTLEFFSE